MHDDVGAVPKGTQQIRARHCVVDNEWQAVLVGNSSDTRDVENVDSRVGNGLAEERLGVWADSLGPRFQVVLIFDEGDLDSELWQRVLKEVVGPSVYRGGAHDVVARVGNVQNGVGGRRLTRGQ